MSWPAALAIAGVAAALLLGGGVCYLIGTVRLQESRIGVLPDAENRQAFRHARRWFAGCAACWLVLAVFWLAVR